MGKIQDGCYERAYAEINPDVKVETQVFFFFRRMQTIFPFEEYDYIVDAVDTVTAKISLVMKGEGERGSDHQFYGCRKQTGCKPV